MQITLTIDLTAENLEKLKAFCGETATAPAQPAKAERAPKAERTAKAEPAPAKDGSADPAESGSAAATETKPATKTDVRALALKLSKAGRHDALKEIFAKFGATKLSEVPDDRYDELMKELADA